MPQNKKNKQKPVTSHLSNAKKAPYDNKTKNITSIAKSNTENQTNCSELKSEASCSSSINMVLGPNSHDRQMRFVSSGKCLDIKTSKHSSNIQSHENSEIKYKKESVNSDNKERLLSDSSAISKYAKEEVLSLDDDDDLAWDSKRYEDEELKSSSKSKRNYRNSSQNRSRENSKNKNNRESWSRDNSLSNKEDDDARNNMPSDKRQSRKSQSYQDSNKSMGDRQSYSSERKLKKEEEFDFFMKKCINDRNLEFLKVTEGFGDLFLASEEYSLGHCVAEDMNMGSGIAVGFRQTFKQVDELLNQRQTQGGLAVLEHHERYIYYLVTKKRSTGKPTLYTMWCSLQKMKNHIVEHNVKKLALPRIGCGLDGMEWSEVKRMLEYTFKDVDIEIKVFNFQQDANIPPVRLRKCPVVNEPYPITKIEYGTVILYFGSEDGVLTKEIKSLSEKFPYISNIYRNENKAVGKYIHTDKYNDGYCFYGCIVRNRHTDLFDFKYFQKCLNSIQMQNRKDKYGYIAFEAFEEDEDAMTVSKIVNLMRHALTDVDIYVCWPEELQKYMPYSNY